MVEDIATSLERISEKQDQILKMLRQLIGLMKELASERPQIKTRTVLRGGEITPPFFHLLGEGSTKAILTSLMESY